MRRGFAHDAIVTMDATGDLRAPGAAITVALCGHLEHEPPCPLAPHHTAATREGDDVRLRVLFAADPADEDEVRARIAEALASGRGRWRVRDSRPSNPRDDEAEHVRRLIAS